MVQKSWAFLSVLTWQLLLWWLNWVICPYRWCSSIHAMKDKVQGRECVETSTVKCLQQYKHYFCYAFGLSHSINLHQQSYHGSHLRAPPCGLPFPTVCLSSSEGMWSFCTGFGLDREPRWSFPQQTYRRRKVPAPSPRSAETPWGLWGSGTGKLVTCYCLLLLKSQLQENKTDIHNVIGCPLILIL